jgi:hypothetical protein
LIKHVKLNLNLVEKSEGPMSFDIHMLHPLVPESYSRQLDERVHIQEMPYGYQSSPPPADTGDFNQAKLESKKEYPHRQRERL